MRSRHIVQNLYSSQLSESLPGMWLTGDRLDLFTFEVEVPPTTDSWWYFIDFEDSTKRDLIFSHSRSWNVLSYYRMNRDLLGNWSGNVTHSRWASVRMNDVGEWMNYIWKNTEDFGTIEQRWDWLNVIKVYGWKIAYNRTVANISDTIITLADGTSEITFNYITWAFEAVPTITDPWLSIATIVVTAWSITSITDTRATAMINAFSATFFDEDSGTLIIADWSIWDTQLSATGVAAWTYGTLATYPILTVNSKGRITSASTAPLPSIWNLAYVHTQLIAASTWNINHWLNSEDIVFSIFDGSNEVIVPDTFTIVDADNVTITFTSNVTGKCVLTVIWWTSSTVAWGSITGTLSSQADLQAALNAKEDTLPLTTIGDLLYRDWSNVTNRLAVWTANKVLSSNWTIPGWNKFIKTTTAGPMNGTILNVVDSDATWTYTISVDTDTTPAWFLEVVKWSGSFTINSTASETNLNFTYTIIK